MMDKCEFVCQKVQVCCNFSFEALFWSNNRRTSFRIVHWVKRIGKNVSCRTICQLSKEHSMIGFCLSEQKVRSGTDLFVLVLFPLGFFSQCKAFWYSFCCLVSNVFCSLHAERCFRSGTTSERYFLRNCVSIMLYLFVSLLCLGFLQKSWIIVESVCNQNGVVTFVKVVY